VAAQVAPNSSKRSWRKDGAINQAMKNGLLAALGAGTRATLLGHSQFVEMGPALGKAPLSHAYFPTSGLISVLAPVEGRHGLEVGVVGCEGYFGPASSAAAKTFELRGQFAEAGSGWCVRSSLLGIVALREPGLQQVLLRYAQVEVTQAARHVACCRFHSLPQRLARWLLTHHERSLSSDIIVTHETLALLLGARRSAITEAMGLLSRNAVIGCGRGHIVVLDAQALRGASCSCYRADRETYARVMDFRGRGGGP
jgi:hypothetical protein